MDRLSRLLVSFLIFAGLPMRTSADELSSGPKAMARPPGDSATDDSSRQSRWPCRLGVPRPIAPKILELWTASPTFQRQCARLAEGNITVAVGLSPLLSPDCAGQHRGCWSAKAAVFSVSTTLRDDMHLEEDLPHELEHVMEQIEARNLARDSVGGRGAWPSGTDAYDGTRPPGRHPRSERGAGRSTFGLVAAGARSCGDSAPFALNPARSCLSAAPARRGRAARRLFRARRKMAGRVRRLGHADRTVAGMGPRRGWCVRPTGAARPR